MMAKEYTGTNGGVSWTPSDSTNLPQPGRCFQVAAIGDVAIEYEDGTQVTWPSCAAGVVHPHNFVKVLATGTDAAAVVVGY